MCVRRLSSSYRAGSKDWPSGKQPRWRINLERFWKSRERIMFRKLQKLVRACGSSCTFTSKGELSDVWACMLTHSGVSDSVTLWGFSCVWASQNTLSSWAYVLREETDRLLCPWDFPGKSTAVGWHFLLQGVFPTQGPDLQVLCLLLCQGCSLPLSHLGSPDACL